MLRPDRDTFLRLARTHRAVPIVRRLMSDQVTPVLAYRRLVAPDARTAPSFLLESVEGGDRAGRWSFLGAQPALELSARGGEATIRDHATGETRRMASADPLRLAAEIIAPWQPLARPEGVELPGFLGGWVGYAGYDSVRWLEPEKLPFAAAPPDDRGLPDLHLALHPEVAIFDHATKMLLAVRVERIDAHPDPETAWTAGVAALEDLVARLSAPGAPLRVGSIDLEPRGRSTAPMSSNFTRPAFEAAVERTKAYIAAGDAFQVVLSQRFERTTAADPFDVYRALRIVNPSPYMIYLQAEGSILIASSPEILCRCDGGRVVNRPLAGTRRRGGDAAEDLALERELRADAKDRAEHVMLVDLGRNDLGRVCAPGSIVVERVLEVERYSHVMHLSSTVTGRLAEERDAWDLLRHTLPVGTVSGAPKVRAMQIIDELEPTRRGPYAGGIGVVGFGGEMDMAIALRTMVVPTNVASAAPWTIHLQAGAGIVADSVPALEFEETVNKAAALARAIDLAESS